MPGYSTMILSKETKRLLTFLVVALPLALLASMIPGNVIINKTKSVPFALMLKSSSTPEKGDYVTYPLKKSRHDYIEDSVLVTKRVECIAGEYLALTPYNIYTCNNNPLGRTLTETSDGRLIKPFHWNGPVPNGKVFLMGSHTLSFDSRAWGFADADKLKRVIPLF